MEICCRCQNGAATGGWTCLGQDSIPDQTDVAEGKLKKLGHHVRLGWEKQTIDSEKNLATVRGAVREQWQKERQENLKKPAPTPEPGQDKTKGREIEPPEPGND